MAGLIDYIEARRIAGTHDTEAPPTEPMASAMPLEFDREAYERTVVNDGGTPAEPDDPCSTAVADDPQAMVTAIWGQP